MPKALLAAGAKPGSKWQYLTPIQWATARGHLRCVKALRAAGAAHAALPAGYHAVPQEASSAANWLLRPPPLVPRLRRKAVSAKATPPAAGEGGGSDSSGLWCGHAWTSRSLLWTVMEDSEEATRLCQQYPCLEVLEVALAKLLHKTRSNRPPPLPDETVASFSIRPGLRLRSSDPDPELDAKVKAAR